LFTLSYYIPEEVKSKLNSGYYGYHSVQDLLSCLLHKTLKIKIHKYIKTLYFALREEHIENICEMQAVEEIKWT
jgi:hypothetical protein